MIRKKRLPKIFLKAVFSLCLISVGLYGVGRLYYALTAGFTESNIVSNLPFNERWNVRSLSDAEQTDLDAALNQKYTYLAKGCQSYVFSSEDGKYVIKFFKYQRFKPQAWLDHFAFIPHVDDYRLYKIEKKQKKLDRIFASWKLAFDELPAETGTLYVHLNKTQHLNKILKIKDKIGLDHALNLDDLEFMVQKKAPLLCPTLNELGTEEAKQLLEKLIVLLISEYQRGYADNDHALMQNTGVYNGLPIHIDIGQLIKKNKVKDPKIYKMELFNKTWKFRIWLRKHRPDLEEYLKELLAQVIGPEFHTMTPNLRKGSVGIIFHDSTSFFKQ